LTEDVGFLSRNTIKRLRAGIAPFENGYRVLPFLINPHSIMPTVGADVKVVISDSLVSRIHYQRPPSRAGGVSMASGGASLCWGALINIKRGSLGTKCLIGVGDKWQLV
jgi:hypothetical protein